MINTLARRRFNFIDSISGMVAISLYTSNLLGAAIVLVCGIIISCLIEGLAKEQRTFKESK